MSIGKVQLCLAMPSRVYRAFSLDHSLHTGLFQVLADSVWVERLVDDIGEGFGHLDSIFCFGSRDEVDGMANIGRGKLGWMTSSGFLKLRALLGTKSRDGRNMETSGRGNGMSRMARIKHGEDGILLSG